MQRVDRLLVISVSDTALRLPIVSCTTTLWHRRLGFLVCIQSNLTSTLAIGFWLIDIANIVDL